MAEGKESAWARYLAANGLVYLCYQPNIVLQRTVYLTWKKRPPVYINSTCASGFNILIFFQNSPSLFLHFVQGIAEAKYILATAVCVSVCLSVYLSLAAFFNDRSVCHWAVYGIFFECHHVRDTIRERTRKFIHKFRLSPNQSCVIYKDKATADLDLH